MFLKKNTEERINKDQIEKISLVSLFNLSEDVISGETILTFIGKKRLKIDNYRNILVYTDAKIRIQSQKYKITVTGEQLRIRYYDKDEMEICGMIKSVIFE